MAYNICILYNIQYTNDIFLFVIKEPLKQQSLIELYVRMKVFPNKKQVLFIRIEYFLNILYLQRFPHPGSKPNIKN